MMKKRIAIVSTGGTIEKTYDELQEFYQIASAFLM